MRAKARILAAEAPLGNPALGARALFLKGVVVPAGSQRGGSPFVLSGGSCPHSALGRVSVRALKGLDSLE